MEVQIGPNPADEPNLLYKLQRKIKVFNTTDVLPNRGYNLVASSSKYGLVFIASPDGILSTYHLKQLVDKDCQSPPHLEVQLQEKPTHISVSCDQELLAVTGGQIISVFLVNHFSNQNVKPSIFMKTDISPTAVVSALQWNPCIPDTIAIAFNDGTLLVAQVINNQIKKVQAKARCICWSPKGKQLVVGNNDGTICQYKPDLTPMKTFPAPNIFQGAPVEVVAINWISTYQFAVVYRNASDDSRPAVTIVNTPKGGQPACLNYEDVCYSMGSSRPWYYYLIGIPQWNMILAASSNSMEIATLGSTDGTNWIQWTLSDEARPELPLTDKKQENYPIGICIDTSAILQLPWGEGSQLPHMPQLLVLAHSGVLCVFYVVSARGAAQLCAPPQAFALPAPGLTTVIPGVAPQDAPAPAPTSTAPTAQPQAPPPAYSAQSTPPVPPANHAPAFASSANQGSAISSSANQGSVFSSSPNQGSVFSSSANQGPAQPPNSVAFTQQPSQGFQALSSLPNQSTPPTTSSAPIVVPTPQPAASPRAPAPAAQPKTPEVNAALKAEQERANKQRANEELKDMLIKEVNDFQTALYKFRVKTRELQIQMQNDLNSLEAPTELQTLDTEKLRQECSLDELRGAIVALKLDLVRACAVVAEARSHSEAQDHQWTQADPLSAKRLASVKKLAYYVQSQLQQAHQALDLRWNEIAAKDAQFNKPGSFMSRPLLDAVYQPLVRQQAVLARQQAALRSLRRVFAECDAAPVFRSASLLRSTPFKKDPLSKLTKNILNMSIEQKDRQEFGLSNKKLEALRDMLSNHKTLKIKPANMELSDHLAAMRLNYEKSVKERGVKLELSPQVVAEVKPEPTPVSVTVPEPVPIIKPDIKAKKILPISVPTYSPTTSAQPAGLAGVARTLFTDEPKTEKPAAFAQATKTPTPRDTEAVPAQVIPASKSGGSSSDMPSEATRSVLKSLLMNKQSAEAASSFMGQNICSPSAFTAPTGPPTSAFTSKPISEISNMMSKYQPSQPFSQLTKPEDSPKMKSLETGEPEDTGEVVIIENKDGKGKSAPFTVKNVPDLAGVTITKVEKKTDKSKENVQEKKEVKPFSMSAAQAPPAAPPAVTATFTLPKPKATKPEVLKPEKSEASTASSVFAAGNAAAPVKTTAPETIQAESKTSTVSSSTTTPPASVFAAAVSQPASIFSSSKNSSVFASASPSSVFASASNTTPVASTAFGSSAKSVFGAAKTPEAPSVFGAASKQETPTPASVFGAAKTEPVSPSSVFGAANKTETSPASVFAATNTKEPGSPSSIFASAVQAEPVTPSSVFGAAKREPPSPASIFASAANPEPPSPSVFASQAETKSVFGSPTPQSVFGAAQATTAAFAATTTTQSAFSSNPIFGSPSSESTVFGATTAQSVFGKQSPSQASIFGGSPSTPASVFGTATPTTQTSVFGSPATSQASIFGAPATTPASVFGSPAPGSVFGATAPTTPASVFGEANMFAAASISTNSASPSGGSIFGGTSSFGGSPSSFGQPSPAAASIFGGGGATAFGQKPAPSLWAGGTATNTGFGSSFAQQATPAPSAFGGGSFSTPAPAAAAGPAPQQQGSVFGSPQQQTASAFGGSPSFGAKPAFGQPSGFGSPGAFGQSAFGGGGFGGFNKSPGGGGFGAGATFSGAPAFGSTSPGKVFGGAAGGFAAPTQSNATFENLATQETLTFGNLAQQSGPPRAAAPAFNTSPSFTGWR